MASRAILDFTLFLLYINNLLDDVICNITIYAGDTTLYSKCNWASDLWQHLQLDSELELDLCNIVDWGRKWLFDFNAEKFSSKKFNASMHLTVRSNCGAIDVKKKNESVLNGKSFFHVLGLSFYYNLDWGSYIVFIAKTKRKRNWGLD